MNHPGGPDTIRDTAPVEDQSLLCTNFPVGIWVIDVTILAGSFPVTGGGGSVGAFTVVILGNSGAKEIPHLTL